MVKFISTIFMCLLLSLSQPASAAHYSLESEGISPVMFQKKLKDLARGLWQELDEENAPVASETEELARLSDCEVQEREALPFGPQ